MASPDVTPEPRPRRRDATWKLVLAFVIPLALAAGIVVVVSRGGNGDPGVPADGGSATSNTNFLVIMTDDQTLESMRVMENTNRLLAAEGTTFSNYYVSFPNCCPSRAAFLTGQYAHNNGVTDNVPPDGGFQKLKGDETLPVWLQRSGYYTASIGKYLNGWGQDGIQPPPGWTHWFGLIDPTTYHYFNYSVSNDGRRQDYGSQASDYQTDVLGAEVQRTITEAGSSGKPWFVQFTPLASHAQYSEQKNGSSLGVDESTIPIPAARHKGRFANEAMPRSPSYNQADVAGLPAIFSVLPPLTPEQEDLLVQLYRAELETLLAVDEWVGRLVQTLRDTGQLDRTVIVFTSDNGVYHGEHRLPFGKVFLFEPATHMPLLIAGGGFPKGKVVDSMAVNVDLAPTVLALAGATPGVTLDGQDLASMARDPSTSTGRVILLESWLNRGKEAPRIETKAVHGQRYVLLRDNLGWNGLYDLLEDRAQVDNRWDDPGLAEVRADLSAKLERLQSCAGQSCLLGPHPR